ncbi:MAG: fibronectin type III domain-containing protein [Ktedonobacteraceae bacterium]|nr:fibronectin type III domain-containing protein [Ktedonobacteraceae bacterium]
MIRTPRNRLLWTIGVIIFTLFLVSATMNTTQATAMMLPQSTASVTVDESHTIGSLPSDFIGLSYEANLLAKSWFDPSRGNLTSLLQTLSKHGSLRVGGNTVDRDVFWQPGGLPVPSWAQTVVTPADIDRLANLARASNWKVRLAVNLGHLDANSIANEAQYASSSLGSYLEDLECGNEPNDYAHNGLRGPSYDYMQYKADFATCAKAIGNAAPIAGPDTTGAFISNFAQDEHSAVDLITQHAYTLSNCSGNPGTATDLLSPASATKEVNQIIPTLNAANAQHLPLRMDETNSVSCGGADGVSNVYASALWAVDDMLLIAQHGVAGVNFHGTLGQCGVSINGKTNLYTPLCASSATDLQQNVFTAQPVYYGMLLVGLLGSGQFLPVTLSTSNNITAYALRGDDGKTRVVVIEKDAPSAKAIALTLHDGNSNGTAQVLNLTGPSLTAHQGIEIQGATVDRNGRFTPRSPDRVQGHNGTYSIRLKPGSAALITLPPPSSKPQKVLYVSPKGNDSNPGTRQRPLKTLQRARDLVRSLNRNMHGDIIVFLEGGVYRLSQPLMLDQRDSGTNGHNIIYTALDDTPVINGGVQVTGWKLTDPKKNLWSAPAPAGLKDTRQLYVSGVRAQRARGRLPVTLTQTSTGYTASSPVMASWRNPSNIEFVYTGGNELWSEGSFGLGAWTEPRCPVASIVGTTITMAQPCWDNSTQRVSYPKNINGGRTVNLVGPASVGKQPEYVENAFELLSEPGQWYFDRNAHTIYYIPRPGEDLKKADVEVPTLETLISGHGTDGHPLHNIIFSGIQFSYATWLQPNSGEGFSEIQANVMLTGSGANATQGLCQFIQNGTCPYGAWTKAPGNLSFSYDTNIQFVKDAFVHLGAAGLDLGNGSQLDTVEGNIFTDISGNGLEIGDVNIVNPTPGQLTTGNKVLNNHLYDLPVEFHGGVGIFNGYTQYTTIQYNQIDHTSYSGISMGWGGWPDKIQQPAQPNPSQHNVLANNLIFDHMQVLADGGAIYTNGLTGNALTNGEQLNGNVVEDQFGSGHGLYTDNGSSYITLQGNVIFNTNFDNWGSRHKDYAHGGKTDDPLDIEDNYWQQGDQDSSKLNVTERNNHLISNLKQVPASILQKAGLQPAFRYLLHIHFGRPSTPEPPSRVAAFAGNGFAYVAWNPPVFEGSTPIKSYTVISSKGGKVTISAADFRTLGYVKLSGLSNGTNYTFTVRANNENGTSSASLPSGIVTPSTAAVGVPTAPEGVSAHPGPGEASVHFKQPGSDGSSPIISYTITAMIGNTVVKTVTITGRTVLVLGTHTTFGVIDGLTSGQAYTITVTANNVAGAGAAATTTVTPT